MKNLITVLLLVIFTYFITGCASKVSYQSKYTEGKTKKELKKVESQTPTIKIQEKTFVKKLPEDSIGGYGMGMDVDMSSLNTNVLKTFLEQYFKDVNIDNNMTKGIYIDTKFEDYRFSLNKLNHGNEMTAKVSARIFYDGKLILDKKYSIVNRVSGYTLRWGPFDLIVENLHETLLKLYEEKMKPDMLIVLENNIKG